MTEQSIPVFAIVGHPNEGKSSVVSTLTENDRIGISPFPGETIRNERFSLKIDQQTIIQFVDTPGFQNPSRTLSWFQSSGLTGVEAVSAFREAHASSPAFDHDCELLEPLSRGAGILFVADASRPVSQSDREEMEILRLIGNPRMAILNPKSDRERFLDDWKNAFRQTFNAIRSFDACKANFENRIDLLEALKSIEQDWSPQLEYAIKRLREERERKTWLCVDIACELLERSLGLKLSKLTSRESDAKKAQSELEMKYRERLASIEQQSWNRLLSEFGHSKLSLSAPENELLSEDLFSDQTWQALGLTRKQLAIAAAGLGAGVGAGLDLALGGIAFGVFTATAAATVAGAALFKGKELARMKIKRIPLGSYKVRVGPNRNEQFPYILLDRFLMFHRAVAKRSHARQDREARLDDEQAKQGVCSQWSSDRRSLYARVFKAMRSERGDSLEKLRNDFRKLLFDSLNEEPST